MTTLPPPPQHECPVGCGRTRSAGHLLCRSCWSSVPLDMQREVHAAWRHWRKDFGDTEAFQDYSDASDRAIGAVR